MFKDKLKELRLKHNLTQEELANILHVSRSLVSKWEQGRGIPTKESLNEIATYFDIAVDDFYDKDEPVAIIEKMNSKNQKNLIVFIITVLILISSMVLILKVKSSRVVDIITKDVFYSKDYLNNYSLSNFEPIAEDSNGSITWNSSYYHNIDSIETFKNYAQYILDYLNESLYISYVGFEIDRPTYDTDRMKFEKYILKSDNVEDYINYYIDKESYGYDFYYIPNLNYNNPHNTKDSIVFNQISITYDKAKKYGIKIDEKDDFLYVNFKMFISSTERSIDTYYFFDDYYNVKKTLINSDNYKDYINVEVNRIGDITDERYWYRIHTKAYSFRTYLPTTLTVTSKNGDVEVNDSVMYSYNYGSIIEMSIVNSELSDDHLEIIYQYDLNINGYILIATPK